MSEADSSVVSAFTEDQVVRLTGVSRRQLRYWATDRFFAPSIKMREEAFADLRLYSFRDLVCLKIINSLRNEIRVSLPELKKTKESLAHLGDDLWSRTTLYVHRKKVVFVNPTTGHKEEATTGQGVLEIPLLVVTGNMEVAVREMRQRDKKAVGRIEHKRSIAQNRPVVAGTKILVEHIQAFHKSGFSIDEIRKQYPALTAEDVQAAIDFKEVA
jgi:uncharacterized protein (DUF433 family)